MLADHGRAAALELQLDGPDSFAIDGVAVADFERAAGALGLDETDDS